MSTQAEAPAAPDLSALTPRQLLNVRVAQTQGWSEWCRYTEDEGYPWVMDGPFPLTCFIKEDGRPIGLSNVPDYAGDPSAWGALMEKERVVPVASKDGWYGIDLVDVIHDPTNEGYCMALHGPQFLADSPGVAVSSAVLSKHGIDPTPYIGD